MRIKIILHKLFRFKPVFAWSICGILLGISVAINQYGIDLNWGYLLIAIIPVILTQGVIAHAVNDIEDVEVDRKTDLSKTNRFKVLVSGVASKTDLIILVCSSFSLTAISAVYLYTKLGLAIFVFYMVAIYASFGYSFPPLKLGWKPYSEWTVVFPVLTTLVVAVTYVATGKFSSLSFFIGVIFSLFNIVWFIVSRMMDYEPDKKSGKITTIVKHGLYIESRVPSYMLDYIHPYLVIVLLVLFWYIVFAVAFTSVSVLTGVVSILSWFMLRRFVPRYYAGEYSNTSVEKFSESRTNLIFVSIINSIAMSITLVFF